MKFSGNSRLELLDRRRFMKENSGRILNINQISVYNNFAENLWALAVRNESIAKTCRDLGINRQPFNKYLSGNVLPNAATLGRITNFFNIDALELFKPPNSDPTKPAITANIVEKTNRFMALENTITELRNKTLDYQLKSGVYSYCLPYQKDSSQCMRGIIVVSVEGGVTYFIRVLRFDDVLSGQNYSRSVAVDGVVTQVSNKLMMLGRNREDGNAINLLSIDANDSIGKIYLLGLLLTFSRTGLPIALQAILYHVGSIETWRRHFKQSGIISLDDATIPNELRSMMRDQASTGNAILNCTDVHKRWRANSV
jgi:transcriptional regulator with XRE-family HTH domain